MTWFAIAGGGAIGAVGRAWLSSRVGAWTPGNLPWGTLAVNLLGCLLIGYVWPRLQIEGVAPQLRAGLIVGVLGAFTTFSTFGLDAVQMLRAGATAAGITYITASNIGGLVLVWVGLRLSG